jgi:hypothetical protein
MLMFNNYLLNYRERLDQGHLHPKVEFLRLTCLSRESNQGQDAVRGKHSSKELFEKHVKKAC